MDNKFQALSKDIHQTERDKLRSVFPECFVEGKLDIDKLLNLCGEYIDESFEKYKFEWKGKADCFRVMGRRSTGTLRPAVDESVNFDTTKNLYIEGDNLEVLKLLQTSYYRKVKMIYIDPPYNTGNDFVYNDDFKDPIAHYKEVTSQATKSNPETMGRFHTAWLNMMYPRLRLAANLLRDDGVIFISIDDNEQANLRKLCDEVFGEENFVANIMWQKRTSPDARLNLGPAHDFIMVYAKFIEPLKESLNKLELSEDRSSQYKNPDNDPRGDWASVDITGQTGHATASQFYEITTPSGLKMTPPSGRCWAMAESTFNDLVADGRIWFGAEGSSRPRKKLFLSETTGTNAWTWWTNAEVGHNQESSKELKELLGKGDIFTNPKPTRLLKRILSLTTLPSDEHIVLDFFSGSASTAHAIMQLNAEDGGNRRFVMVQLPETVVEENNKAAYDFLNEIGKSLNICEIGKERIRRAGAKIDVGDTGFRTLKLDTSNLLAWDASPIPDHDLDVLWQRFDARDKTLKPDRSDMDIVFEVMLKMGIPLDSVVHEITVGSKKCYSIGETLLVCLEFGITPEDITAMCDLAPEKIVCAEEAFADSNVMSNAHYILRDRGIEMKLL